MKADEAKHDIDELLKDNNAEGCPYYEALLKAKEALDLLEKQEQGKIIELPVPIGTEVWSVGAFRAYPCIVENHWLPKLWGDVTFETKEEAEKRLAELRGEE